MSKENKYFQQALHNFTSDVAYGAAVRHLYDLGMSPEEIQSNLDYPTSIEKINKVIASYIKEKEDAKSTGSAYEIRLEYDEYGRRSYRRVKKD